MALAGRSRSVSCVIVVTLACVCILPMLSHRLTFVAHHAARVSVRRAPKTTRFQQSSETNRGVLEELVERVLSIIKDAKKHFPDERAALESIPDDLYKKLRIMFIGGYNVGKSTLINALIGNETCETGDIPTTMNISTVAGPNGTTFVDSMGTNAPDYAEHKNQVKEEMREADVVFLVLNAKQSFTPEVVELCKVLNRTKPKVAIIVNQWDLIKAENQNACRKRDTDLSEEYLPFASGIFFVSAEDAMMQDPDADYIGREGFVSLQAFIQGKLGNRDAQTAQKILTALNKMVRLVDQDVSILARQVETNETQKKKASEREDMRSDEARRVLDDFEEQMNISIEVCRDNERHHTSQTNERLATYATKISELNDKIAEVMGLEKEVLQTVLASLSGGSATALFGAGGFAVAFGILFGGVTAWLEHKERKARLDKLCSEYDRECVLKDEYEGDRRKDLEFMKSRRVQLESERSSRLKKHEQSEKKYRERFSAEQSTLDKQIDEARAKIEELNAFRSRIEASRRDCQQYSDGLSH